MAEYIWMGSAGAELRGRTVVLDERPLSAEDLPIAGALPCGRFEMKLMHLIAVKLSLNGSCAALLDRCFTKHFSRGWSQQSPVDATSASHGIAIP